MWDIVWVSPHRSVSVSCHFLLQAPRCPCSMRKRFSRDHCCRGRSKHGCRIVGSHTRWELTTWADFQLCLHRLLMSTGCKSSHNGFLDVSCSNGGLRISGWIDQLLCLMITLLHNCNTHGYYNKIDEPAFISTWLQLHVKTTAAPASPHMTHIHNVKLLISLITLIEINFLNAR